MDMDKDTLDNYLSYSPLHFYAKYTNPKSETRTNVRIVDFKDIILLFIIVFFVLQIFIVVHLVMALEAQNAQPILKGEITACVSVVARGKIGIATQKQWIYLCKLYFNEYLETNLNITMSDAKAMKELLNDFYTTKKFTDRRHLELLRAIDYHKGVGNNYQSVEKADNTTISASSFSKNSALQSIQDLLIEFEDLQQEELTRSDNEVLRELEIVKRLFKAGVLNKRKHNF